MRGKKALKLNGMRSQQIQNERLRNSESTVASELGQWLILVAVVFALLIVLSSTFLRIPILIPTQWVSVVFFLYLTPIFLYSLGTMSRPLFTLTIVFPSLALGELLWCVIYGCAGELPLNVILAISTWGVGSLLISLLREKNEVVAMCIGALWGLIGLLIPTLIYYALILDWSPLYMIIYALLSTGFNLVFIPVSLLLNRILRKTLRVRYLDDLLLLQ